MRQRSRRRLPSSKFASCDGCQLTLLDCEDSCLAVAQEVEIAYFLGGVPDDAERPLCSLARSKARSRRRTMPCALQCGAAIQVPRGHRACATAGGIQALRNSAMRKNLLKPFTLGRPRFPRWIDLTPISEHVAVDFELRAVHQQAALLEVISAFLHGRKPNVLRATPCA